MYDATIRAMYAEMYKTAAATIPGRVGSSLVSAMQKYPLLAATLIGSGGVAGGAVLADKHRTEVENARLHGFRDALGMGGMHGS